MAVLSLESLERRVAKLLDEEGVAACRCIEQKGAYGYYIRTYPALCLIVVYWVESRPNKTSYAEQMDFVRNYERLLVSTFGRQRVSHTAGKLVVVGRRRLVRGLAVSLPRR